MGARNYGNVPLYSTTAASVNDPSTATLVAELIVPNAGPTAASLYEARFAIGGSTGMLWRLECAASSGLGSTAIRLSDNDSSNAFQRALVYTGSNQTSEFVFTFKAYPGDRLRAVPQIAPSTGNSAAGTIQAECLS